MFKPLPPPKPLTFDVDLSKEAKRINNKEKGKAADEKYLGEQQNLDARVRKIEQNSELPPWED